MLSLISLPYEPILFGIEVNMNLVLEYLAFLLGFDIISI